MTKYVIKNYKEEFLEAQEQVGREATKDWTGFGQTPAERLKELYSGDNFDPETKFYAFLNDKLVGFLTSNIIEDENQKYANLEFPITLAEHSACAELLFETAINTLKKKGVTRVQSRVGTMYHGTSEKAKKWGFKYLRDLYILMEANVNNIKTSESKIALKEFDPEQDLEQMVKLFVDKLGATEEYARTNFKRIINDKETFPVHLLIKKNDQIVGRILAYKQQDNPKEYNLGSLYIEEEQYFEPLISAAVEKAKSFGAEKIRTFLFGQTLNMEDQFISVGFEKKGKIDYYEKEI